jgi:hypothetical protein
MLDFLCILYHFETKWVFEMSRYHLPKLLMLFFPWYCAKSKAKQCETCMILR